MKSVNTLSSMVSISARIKATEASRSARIDSTSENSPSTASRACFASSATVWKRESRASSCCRSICSCPKVDLESKSFCTTSDSLLLSSLGPGSSSSCLTALSLRFFNISISDLSHLEVAPSSSTDTPPVMNPEGLIRVPSSEHIFTRTPPGPNLTLLASSRVSQIRALPVTYCIALLNSCLKDKMSRTGRTVPPNLLQFSSSGGGRRSERGRNVALPALCSFR
mmetsp:Transcript_27200/g.105905  ORF Transcript_27200/g.105905 Transcript_27200/m.105905 type:complete len:224 (+) Transcript_27200:4611-5282(+)